MNCDVEVIEAEPDHEPDQRHHDQGGEQALGVEVGPVIRVSLPGQREVTGHRGVSVEDVKLRHGLRRPLESDLEDVARVGEDKKLEERMKAAVNVNVGLFLI